MLGRFATLMLALCLLAPPAAQAQAQISSDELTLEFGLAAFDASSTGGGGVYVGLSGADRRAKWLEPYFAMNASPPKSPVPSAAPNGTWRTAAPISGSAQRGGWFVPWCVSASSWPSTARGWNSLASLVDSACTRASVVHCGDCSRRASLSRWTCGQPERTTPRSRTRESTSASDSATSCSHAKAQGNRNASHVSFGIPVNRVPGLAAGRRQPGGSLNLLKLVWVEAVPVRCLHSRGTASR